MSWYWIIVGILGLGLLMVVHESGHLLAARAFGMRVIRFSVGFGPALWRHKPKGSETEYQVALIPFLAYVQIAGMNPLEEIDQHDKGSYANASLIGRITAIFGGPLANYLFATVLFFAAFMIGGKLVPSTKVKVRTDSAAMMATMRDGDQIVTINGTPIRTWEEMREKIVAFPGKALDVVVLRDGAPLTLQVTPKANSNGEGQIGVEMVHERVPMDLKEAGVQSVVDPARIVRLLVVGLARIATGKEKLELKGPVGIVQETGRAAQLGVPALLYFLGVLSAYLGGFNLLPFPALDGGRLMFLGYEAVTRRRPNARVEAQVHMVGLVMLLALIAVVSVFDLSSN